jgi:hypothetical protein
MKEKTKKVLIQSLPVILISLLTMAVLIYAWQEPSQSPPQENVFAPINVGDTPQFKSGALGVGGIIYGYSNAFFDGNVGIGTTTTEAKLHIKATNTTTAPFRVDDATNRSRFYIQPGTGNVGIGTTTPQYALGVVGNIYATGRILSSSDIRLKENVSEIKDALEKILKLQGVNFYWKGSGEKSIGLIAQEVEKIFPEVINTDNSGMKSIDYGRLTAVLIEGIKEQQKEIDSLKQEVEKLKVQIKGQ